MGLTTALQWSCLGDINQIQQVKKIKYLSIWLNNRKLGVTYIQQSDSVTKWKITSAIAELIRSHDPP